MRGKLVVERLLLRGPRGARPHTGIEILAARLVGPGAHRARRTLCLLKARPRLEQLCLGDNCPLAPIVGELEARSERDRFGRTSLSAVPAVDATHQVDLVPLRVALARGDRRFGVVLSGEHVDASDRARGGTQLAADAALEAV